LRAISDISFGVSGIGTPQVIALSASTPGDSLQLRRRFLLLGVFEGALDSGLEVLALGFHAKC
jgi:hypothetical protein